MTSHGWAALSASLLTAAIFTPYLLRVWRGSLRPSVASWIIWGLITLLVAGGQALAGAGVGALPILLSGALSVAVAALSAIRRETTSSGPAMSRLDRWCLVTALATIPLWMVTGDELWSMVVLTAIDLIGFIPTVRRIWRDPHADSALLFLAFALRNTCALLALERVDLTTVLFPAVIGAACAMLALLIAVRRAAISNAR